MKAIVVNSSMPRLRGCRETTHQHCMRLWAFPAHLLKLSLHFSTTCSGTSTSCISNSILCLETIWEMEMFLGLCFHWSKNYTFSAFLYLVRDFKVFYSAKVAEPCANLRDSAEDMDEIDSKNVVEIDWVQGSWGYNGGDSWDPWPARAAGKEETLKATLQGDSQESPEEDPCSKEVSSMVVSPEVRDTGEWLLRKPLYHYVYLF